MIDAHGAEKVVAVPIGDFEGEMKESTICRVF
jgi:hypothetical protein